MDTKQRIIEQASGMFFKYGIRGITMDEIAESLGMSKRTVYESFSNKEELLQECIEFKYQEGKLLREDLLAQNPDDPLEVIRQHFRHVILALNELHPNFFNDMKKYHSRLWIEHIESKQEENIEFTRNMILTGIEKGVFRESANPDILSRMIHQTMQMITLSDIFPESRYPRAEVVIQILFNFIRGLATPDGLNVLDQKFQQ